MTQRNLRHLTGPTLAQHAPYRGMTSRARTVSGWNLAVVMAHRLTPPDWRRMSRKQVVAVAADLRRHAAASVRHVRDFTGLDTAGPPSVIVMGRSGWRRSNVASFRELLEPALASLDRDSDAPSVTTRLAGRVAGVVARIMFFAYSSAVMGQHGVVIPASNASVRLVAPNIVRMGRRLGVDPSDVGLWVCLHEETHRVQFTAVPWLGGYVENLVRPSVARAGDGACAPADKHGRKRALRDRRAAVMSLLEGHAEYVSHSVGPDVVPTMEEFREKCARRRWRVVTRLRTRVLGLGAKMRQYRAGERFVRTVVEQAGMDGFNTVWTSPDTLPTLEEIHHPNRWLARTQPARESF